MFSWRVGEPGEPGKAGPLRREASLEATAAEPKGDKGAEEPKVGAGIGERGAHDDGTHERRDLLAGEKRRRESQQERKKDAVMQQANEVVERRTWRFGRALRGERGSEGES